MGRKCPNFLHTQMAQENPALQTVNTYIFLAPLQSLYLSSDTIPPRQFSSHQSRSSAWSDSSISWSTRPPPSNPSAGRYRRTVGGCVGRPAVQITQTRWRDVRMWLDVDVLLTYLDVDVDVTQRPAATTVFTYLSTPNTNITSVVSTLADVSVLFIFVGSVFFSFFFSFIFS